MFIVVFSHTAANSPAVRQECMDAGVNMVSWNLATLTAVVMQVGQLYTASREGPLATHGAARFACPFCDMGNLSEDLLWAHTPLYHINTPNDSPAIAPCCPICGEDHQTDMQVHIHNRHGPPGRGEAPSEVNQRVPALHAFALVLVRDPGSGRILLVQEFGNV